MSKSKENLSNLLAAIQRKTAAAKPMEETSSEPTVTGTESEGTPAPVEKIQKRVKAKVQARSGGPVNIWMQDDDRRLVRELSAWLAGQGMRTTDSMVIRAALRAAKIGGAFLEACREVAKTDGRLKQNQNSAD